MTTRTGAETEAFVEGRLRSALDPSFRIYANVSWLGRASDRGPNRDGEADLVIAHPDRGIFVIETKAGELRREPGGGWFGGGRRLDVSPQEQAKKSKHALLSKLKDLPDWEVALEPIAGQAIAVPDVELVTAHGLLGPDLDPEIILDASSFDSDVATRAAFERMM